MPQLGEATDDNVSVTCDLKCSQFLIAWLLPLKHMWHILFSFLLVMDDMTLVDFLTV